MGYVTRYLAASAAVAGHIFPVTSPSPSSPTPPPRRRRQSYESHPVDDILPRDFSSYPLDASLFTTHLSTNWEHTQQSMQQQMAHAVGAVTLPELAVPGQRIGSIGEIASGPGTHVWGTSVHASITGALVVDASQAPPLVSVRTAAPSLRTMQPEVGELVTCRVTRISPRQAHLEIICVSGAAMHEPCSAYLHKEDVRDFETDKVEMHKCFRPGDIVLARITSLGDSRAYYVTTKEDELGVVFAQSAHGATMQPLSWQEMLCPLTKTREMRKVAKPESLDENPEDME